MLTTFPGNEELMLKTVQLVIEQNISFVNDLSYEKLLQTSYKRAV